jgi:hypothetical protein
LRKQSGWKEEERRLKVLEWEACKGGRRRRGKEGGGGRGRRGEL